MNVPGDDYEQGNGLSSMKESMDGDYTAEDTLKSIHRETIMNTSLRSNSIQLPRGRLCCDNEN